MENVPAVNMATIAIRYYLDLISQENAEVHSKKRVKVRKTKTKKKRRRKTQLK